MLDHERPPADGSSQRTEKAGQDPDDGAKTQRLNGVVDVSRPGRVVGWAIDRSDPEAAVDVEIYRDGRHVVTVHADRHREDLVRGGIGTGKYGFVAELAPQAELGMEFAVTAIARAADGTRAPLRPIGKAAPSSDPGRRLLERTFEEVISLRADIARLRKQGSGSNEESLAGFRDMLERIEVVQARLEERVAPSDRPDGSQNDKSLRLIAGAALLIAVGSLTLGIFSMLQG